MTDVADGTSFDSMDGGISNKMRRGAPEIPVTTRAFGPDREIDHRAVWLGLLWLAAAVMISVGVGVRFGASVGLIVGGVIVAVLAWLTFGDVT